MYHPKKIKLERNLEDGELDESDLENYDDIPKSNNEDNPARKVTILRKKG